MTYSDTGTKNWGNGIKFDFFRDTGYMGGLANAVLLKCTVDGVSGQ